MHIGYLMNTYPVTSGTFIRREIHALERQGVTVQRYAVRRWDQELVDPRDRDEQGRTFYLLSGRAPALILSFIAELFANPRGVLGAARLTLRLIGNAGGGVVRHLAYLMEAASLKRRARRDGITHIHTHFSTNPAAVAMLSAAMGGPGYSFTAHGPDEFVDRSSHSLGLKIERARFVVAISHFSRMTLILAGGWGTRGKIRIVRCGLDLAEFPLSEANFDTGEIVCVGRLCPQKGQTLIPKAVAQVAETHPALRVTLIGDGESRAEIEAEIAALDLAD
ncbi:MAG: glycosyltransferase, partial [Pseudomonadota bacterium]